MKTTIITLSILFCYTSLLSQVIVEKAVERPTVSLAQKQFELNSERLKMHKSFSKKLLTTSSFGTTMQTTPNYLSLSNPSHQRMVTEESILRHIRPAYEHSILLQPRHQLEPKINSSLLKDEWYDKNRRLIYSSIWAYASLNYLYCDLAGFMDADMLSKYQSGTVDGIEMTPELIATSAAFMQIALANVFLPHVIKNDRVLRWVQIASGAIMTIVQSATLFVGKPTAYYAVFSGFEIAATTYITIDAIRWRTK